MEEIMYKLLKLNYLIILKGLNTDQSFFFIVKHFNYNVVICLY